MLFYNRTRAPVDVCMSMSVHDDVPDVVTPSEMVESSPESCTCWFLRQDKGKFLASKVDCKSGRIIYLR